ncbi:MAG: hypothetical protein IPM23_12680 [Candidatus Melainabacteria bacterium]|nr:hypothetical protein [Candidatus Melainabacteria bacterium]
MSGEIANLTRPGALTYASATAGTYIVINTILLLICSAPLLALLALAAYNFFNSIPLASELVGELLVGGAMLFLFFALACAINLKNWWQWRGRISRALQSEPHDGYLCEFSTIKEFTFADIRKVDFPDRLFWSEPVLAETCRNFPHNERMPVRLFFDGQVRDLQGAGPAAIEIDGCVILSSPPRIPFIGALEAAPAVLKGVNRH